MVRYSLFVLAAAFVFLGCSAGRADEKTLALYVRSAGAYEEGRFEECARLLEGAAFPPALVLRGKAEYFSDQPELAGKTLRRAWKHNPASEEAPLFLARILRDSGSHDDARSLVERLLANNPEDVRALRLGADLAAETGDPAGAAGFLDRAAAAAMETSLVFLDRAKLRWKAGNGPGAQEDLRRAAILLPPNVPLQRSIAELYSRISAAGGGS